jgi:hypothetical protein
MRYIHGFQTRNRAISDVKGKLRVVNIHELLAMKLNQPKIVPWKKWKTYFKEPSTGTLKYMLLDRKDTGFERCVRYINNRIYLDVEETFKFFNECKHKT